jgi:phosphotransacetylase
MHSSANTLKEIAPFLDPHLLLFTLQKTTDAKATGALQTNIKNKLLINKKEEAKKLEEQGKKSAQKLLDILNGPDFQRLREEHRFTLESLKKEKGVTISDCQKLQNYAKILYEQGKYKGKFWSCFSLMFQI